jgi:hypothetical protein
MEATINDVIDFIDGRKSCTGLAKWTRSQIGTYVHSNIESKGIRIVTDSTQVTGVIIFDSAFRHGFYVDQLWAINREVMSQFIRQLQIEFPDVEFVWGWRTNCLVKFKLSTLIKIYGRRSSCTTTK